MRIQHFVIVTVFLAIVGASACDGSGAMSGLTTGSGTVVGPACDPDSLGPCNEDMFICTADNAGNKECVGQRPASPDSGDWDCEISGSAVVCRGDHVPTTDGGLWACHEEGDEVVCVTQGFIPEESSSGGDWDCVIEDRTVVCAEEGFEDSGEDGEGDPPSSDDPDHPGDDIPEFVPGGGDPCDPWITTTVRFGGSGELMSLDRPGAEVDCTTVEVDITGYYAFYDDRIAESCMTQLDETGFLSVTNSCNPVGLPEEDNVGDWYVVQDVDNTVRCSTDGECAADQACRAGNAGFCCVPRNPIYMGTFQLVAGETNELCINHWCPLWRGGRSGDGFATAECTGSINSIHVPLDGSMTICLDPGHTPSC